MGYKGPERRQYKRVRNEHAKVSIDFGEKGWQLVAVLNYGLGGMLCYSGEQVKAKAILDVKIDIPGEENSINCKIQVIRCDKVDHDMNLLALVFEGMKTDDEERFKKAIQNGM